MLIALVSCSLTRHVQAATYFADPVHGDNALDGSQIHPWKTITHALDQLMPGDSLLLQGGRYREHVRISLQATAEAPITIRAAQGQQVVLDGGLSEFFDQPQQAWVPVKQGASDEYRSTRRYRNLTDIAGNFGDSGIGLHTYWRLADLCTDNELTGYNPKQPVVTKDIYCGPGLWLDGLTGYIHIRLSPTHNNSQLTPDYDGPTDPRTIKLILSSVDSVPLTIDGARHVHIEGLTLVGGGFDTLVIENSNHVSLDRLNIVAGSVRGQTSGNINLRNSTIRGPRPSWMWRTDGSTGCADGSTRDVVRVICPTLIDTATVRITRIMPRVIYYDYLRDRPLGMQPITLATDDAATPQMLSSPMNHNWTISGCRISDGHDGIFLAGDEMRLDHNVIEDFQDDAVDFSTGVAGLAGIMRIDHNRIIRCVTALSTHNWGRSEVERGTVQIDHNLIDLTQPVAWARPTPLKPQGMEHPGMGFFMHGADHSPNIESLWLTQNTVIAHQASGYFFSHGFMNHIKADSVRRVVDNLFIYLGPIRGPYVSQASKGLDMLADGNLHWSPAIDPATLEDRLIKLRKHPLSIEAKHRLGMAWAEHSQVGDPEFMSFDVDQSESNDYRLRSTSPAMKAGVPLPTDMPFPPAASEMKHPTIGAFLDESQMSEIGVPLP